MFTFRIDIANLPDLVDLQEEVGYGIPYGRCQMRIYEGEDWYGGMDLKEFEPDCQEEEERSQSHSMKKTKKILKGANKMVKNSHQRKRRIIRFRKLSLPNPRKPSQEIAIPTPTATQAPLRVQPQKPEQQKMLSVPNYIKEFYRISQIFEFMDPLVVHCCRNPVLGRAKADIKAAEIKRMERKRRQQLDREEDRKERLMATAIKGGDDSQESSLESDDGVRSSPQKKKSKSSSSMSQQQYEFSQPQLFQEPIPCQLPQSQPELEQSQLKLFQIKTFLIEGFREMMQMKAESIQFLVDVLETKKVIGSLKPVIEKRVQELLIEELKRKNLYQIKEQEQDQKEKGSSKNNNKAHAQPEPDQPSATKLQSLDYHVCPKCWLYFQNGHQLGGHMSKKHPGGSLEYKNKRITEQTKRIERNRRTYLKIVYQAYREKNSSLLQGSSLFVEGDAEEIEEEI